MAFTFSDLAFQVYYGLGKIPPFHQFVATGGGTLTIQNSLWTGREDAPDDNYANDYIAFVRTDTAGSAPQGEIQRVSAYTAGTYTVDTAFSAAVAAGDTIAIANSDIPLREMYAAANRALLSVGDVENVDSSLTLSSSTDRYTLPTGTKMEYPMRVEYTETSGTITEFRQEVPGWRATADGYIYIPYVSSGVVFLTYIGPHAALTTYSSVISEDIHPQLAIAATTAAVLEWLNGTQGGSTQYMLQRENKALQDLERAKAEHPAKRIGKQAKWFVA